jgi:nucleoside permease nupG
MHSAHIKLRLTVMNFLQFAIWGAYLTSMGRYLGDAGFAEGIGNFYAVQGIVSLFMPALMGIVADRWIPAQRLLGLCHALAGGLMLALFAYSLTEAPSYSVLFSIYTLSVAFYMPTLALSNSVAYTSLEQAGLDLVKSFPPIRVFGTVGFICTMITVSLIGVEATSGQFAISGGIGLVLALYAQTLPHCPTAPKGEGKGLVEALGLKAFALFKERKMALFFVFSMLLGVSLQITNGFANPFISSFGEIPAYAETFGVKHANILISLSQLSETLCILLIPFALRRFGIKIVMLIAMLAWVLRFAFLGLGDPGAGVWLFLLSMVVYGVAFDFFNVSGSLFVDKETDPTIRSSAQGLFMIMTNGIGATLGSLGAQAVINHFVYSEHDVYARLAGWSLSWYLFAAYAAIVAVLFAVLFRYRADRAR